MSESDTVVVLTPMSLEFKAMRAQLVDRRRERHPEGTIFEVGRVPGAPWHVALAVTGEGVKPAAVLATRAIGFFAPKALLVVGIAGALKDDIEIGDVVVATWAHDYHGGKEDRDGLHERPRGWAPSHALEQVARMVDVDDTWAKDLSAPAKPTVHFKPIAAGDVVLNARDTSLGAQLKRSYNDAAAIEMESSGVALAAQLNGSVPLLTIRGISDRADGDKHLSDEAGLQPRAAAHAAAFAAALLREWANTETAPSGIDSVWRPVAEPLPVAWLSELRPANRAASALLELHLVPAATGKRLEARRMAELPEELAVLGRAEKLFDPTEGLESAAPAAMVSTPRAGLAVTRAGQRSAWHALPRDSHGAVLDPEDVTERLAALLVVLTQLSLPGVAEVGIAVGVSHTYVLLSEGRVRDLPRQHSRPRTSSAPLRVGVDDVLPYDQLSVDPHGVAEELSARLMQAFRDRR